MGWVGIRDPFHLIHAICKKEGGGTKEWGEMLEGFGKILEVWDKVLEGWDKILGSKARYWTGGTRN